YPQGQARQDMSSSEGAMHAQLTGRSSSVEVYVLSSLHALLAEAGVDAVEVFFHGAGEGLGISGLQRAEEVSVPGGGVGGGVAGAGEAGVHLGEGSPEDRQQVDDQGVAEGFVEGLVEGPVLVGEVAAF